MEATEKIIKKENEVMRSIRESIKQIVGIRLEAMKTFKWVTKQDVELELATSEIEEAIEALSRAETAMGNAHQNLLVSQATLLTGLKESD